VNPYETIDFLRAALHDAEIALRTCAGHTHHDPDLLCAKCIDAAEKARGALAETA
jgi:hypothetical protein